MKRRPAPLLCDVCKIAKAPSAFWSGHATCRRCQAEASFREATGRIRRSQRRRKLERAKAGLLTRHKQLVTSLQDVGDQLRAVQSELLQLREVEAMRWTA